MPCRAEPGHVMPRRAAPSLATPKRNPTAAGTIAGLSRTSKRQLFEILFAMAVGKSAAPGLAENVGEKSEEWPRRCEII